MQQMGKMQSKDRREKRRWRVVHTALKKKKRGSQFEGKSGLLMSAAASHGSHEPYSNENSSWRHLVNEAMFLVWGDFLLLMA